jgi:hypothetical protein
MKLSLTNFTIVAVLSAAFMSTPVSGQGTLNRLRCRFYQALGNTVLRRAATVSFERYFNLLLPDILIPGVDIRVSIPQLTFDLCDVTFTTAITASILFGIISDTTSVDWQANVVRLRGFCVTDLTIVDIDLIDLVNDQLEASVKDALNDLIPDTQICLGLFGTPRPLLLDASDNQDEGV